MPERSWSMLFIIAWAYTLLFCALIPLITIAFWYYHPAEVLRKIITYAGSETPPDKAGQFDLIKIYIQSIITFLTTLFFGAGAYIIVTYHQEANARLELAKASL